MHGKFSAEHGIGGRGRRGAKAKGAAQDDKEMQDDMAGVEAWNMTAIPEEASDPVTRHSHHHSPAEKKRQLNRIARIIGHLEHVRRLIEDDADCAHVLVQLSAVRSALNGLGKQIINEHVVHCISHAIEDGDVAEIEAFQTAIQKYI